MNYSYDYRSYFQEIIGDLDSLLSGQEDLSAEVEQINALIDDKLDQIDLTLSEGFVLLSSLLVAVIAMVVFFK